MTTTHKFSLQDTLHTMKLEVVDHKETVTRPWVKVVDKIRYGRFKRKKKQLLEHTLKIKISHAFMIDFLPFDPPPS